MSYTVHVQGNGGTPSTYELTNRESITSEDFNTIVSNITRDKYYISGLSLTADGEAIELPYTLTADTTVYCLWEIQSYTICGENCLKEAMTKEEVVAFCTSILETGTIPSSFNLGCIDSIKEQNGGLPIKFWLGTNAEYNAIETKDANTFYIMSDDSTRNDLVAAINTLNQAMTGVDTAISNIEARLESLGFRQGTVQEPIGTVSKNTLNRQGNYVIGDFSVNLLNAGTGIQTIFVFPPEFMPKDGETIPSHLIKVSNLTAVHSYPELSADSDGNVSLNITSATSLMIHFGYEAAPLE